MADEQVAYLCTNCGTSNIGKKKFCSECGTSLMIKDHPTSASPPQTTLEKVDQQKTLKKNILIGGGVVLFLLGIVFFLNGGLSTPIIGPKGTITFCDSVIGFNNANAYVDGNYVGKTGDCLGLLGGKKTSVSVKPGIYSVKVSGSCSKDYYVTVTVEENKEVLVNPECLFRI